AYIRSTDVNRTLISAYANLAGMYPAGEPGTDFPRNGHWPAHWTPIPVHTVPLETDFIGNVLAECPRVTELYEELQRSPEYKELQQKNQDFFDYVNENSGRTYDLSTIYLLSDVNYIETLYNMSQPAWLNTETVLKARNLTRTAAEFLYGIGKPYVPELTKLRGGSMLKALVDKMKQKVHCQDAANAATGLCKWIGPLKYYAYSAHDTTVAALLSTFGDEEEVVRSGLPHYTASVALELWNLDGVGPAVRLLYHSAFHHNYRVITDLTKGCPRGDEYCPLATFEERRSKFIPQDIEAECRAKRTFRWHKQAKENEQF
ncbi:Protein PHO-14, partial [Aphelenchoides avenae]